VAKNSSFAVGGRVENQGSRSFRVG